MNRESALALLKENMKTGTLLMHSLETEAVLREIAADKGQDVDQWGIAGLLHDVDFEETKDTPEIHGKRALEILADTDLEEEVLHAIVAHNGEMTGVKRESDLDYALAAGETITGLIVASILVRPDRDAANAKVKSIRKKFKDKAFARNVRREVILECEKLGYELPDFIALSLKAFVGMGKTLVL